MLVDTSAWIEYFQGTAKGRKVRETVESDQVLYSSPVVLAELVSKSVRTDGAAKANERVQFVRERTVLVPIDGDIGVEAGKIHAARKKGKPDYGMADALIEASARTKGVGVFSFDPHLAGLVFSSGNGSPSHSEPR